MSDPAPLAVPALEARILLCRWRRIGCWGSRDRRAPFWRLYWNETPGAWIRADNRTTELTPDTVVLIAPDTSFFCHQRGVFDHFFLHFILSESYTVDPGTVVSRAVTTTERRRLADFAARIRRSPVCPPALGLELHTYLLEALGAVPDPAWRPAVQDARVRAAVGLLQANLAHPPGNAELASRFGLHPNSFVRLFTQCVGVPPHRYALLARLDRATHDLLHTDLSVDTIAELWGFTDRQHLTRSLRRHRHVTPRQLRGGASS